MNSKLINLAASFIALIVLFIIISSAIIWTSNEGKYQTDFLPANAFFGVVAVILWARVAPIEEMELPSRYVWIFWVSMAFIGAITTLLFLTINCGGALPVFHPEFSCNGHLGIETIITFSGIDLTFIAIPTAIRAWIIHRFEGHYANISGWNKIR